MKTTDFTPKFLDDFKRQCDELLEEEYNAFMLKFGNTFKDTNGTLLEKYLTIKKNEIISHGILHKYHIIDIPQWLTNKSDNMQSDFFYEDNTIPTEIKKILGIKSVVKYLDCIFLLR